MKSNLPYLFSLILGCLILVGCKHQEQNASAETPAVSAPPASYPDGYSADEEAEVTENKEEVGKPDLTVPTGIQTTYSGLKYEVLKAGTGRQATRYNHVRVNYRGYFPDGRTFDSNNDIVLSLSQVVQGWQEGIPLMKEGARYRFTVPPHLGYGSQGRPPTIPPNATLMFDIDLLEVKY